MAKLRGPHLSTPLTLLGSDRDALLRGDEGILAPGDDARYLVSRAGAVALREDEDGTLHAVLETEDPRGGTLQPLVLLGRREGYRVLAVEVPEPSAELDDPGGICGICGGSPIACTSATPTSRPRPSRWASGTGRCATAPSAERCWRRRWRAGRCAAPRTASSSSPAPMPR